MDANRITPFFASSKPKKAPKPSGWSVPPGFVACPAIFGGMQAWQQAIYRLAYDLAQADVQLPRHHRELFAVWN